MFLYEQSQPNGGSGSISTAPTVALTVPLTLPSSLNNLAGDLGEDHSALNNFGKFIREDVLGHTSPQCMILPNSVCDV